MNPFFRALIYRNCQYSLQFSKKTIGSLATVNLVNGGIAGEIANWHHYCFPNQSVEFYIVVLKLRYKNDS